MFFIKLLVSAFFSFLFLIVSSLVTGAEELGDLRAGVVKVRSINTEGKPRTGTGFIVRLEEQGTYIATAAHVVEGDQNPQVAFFPQANRFFPAKTLGTEGGKHDGVAVLLVEGAVPTGLRSLTVSLVSTIPDGKDVAVIGFPGETNTSWVISKGVIAGRRGTDMTFTGFVGEGNSGGPLFLNGQVLGIVTEMGEQFGYAVPMITAQIALEGWGVTIENTSHDAPTAKSSGGELENIQAELDSFRKRDEERAAELGLIKKEEQQRIIEERQQQKDALRHEIQALDREFDEVGGQMFRAKTSREKFELHKKQYLISERRATLSMKLKKLEKK